MIYGLGIDLVEVHRIEAALQRFGDRFLKKIAHPAELKTAPKGRPRRGQYWAARFAAKEAFAKAMGTGIGRVVGWRSVGVAKKPTGQPTLQYDRKLEATLRKIGVKGSHVAITHTEDSAVAVVVLMAGGGKK